MRNRLPRSLRGVLIFLFWLALATPLTAAEPLKLRLVFQNADNFPYEVGDGETVNVGKPGIALEMLQLVAQKLDLTFEFQRLPWKRCFIELQRGQVDGLFSASFKPERMESGAYPMQAGVVDVGRRLYSTAYVLYAFTGTAVQWDGKVFTVPPQSVGAVSGYSIVADLTKMGVKVVEIRNTFVAFKNLHAQFFDAVAALELAGDAILKQHTAEWTNILKIAPPLKTVHYYLMLSQQFVQAHPALAEDIWNTSGVIRESDEFKHITEKYFQDEALK